MKLLNIIWSVVLAQVDNELDTMNDNEMGGMGAHAVNADDKMTFDEPEGDDQMSEMENDTPNCPDTLEWHPAKRLCMTPATE